MTGAHIGDDQRVFPQLALGVAAADPRQFGNRRFEQADRAVIVACRKRPDAAAELDRAAARRQLAVGRARFQLGQSRVQRITACH